MFKHFLAAKFDTSKPQLAVLELKSGTNVIGRNEFEIADKRISRHQLELVVDPAKRNVELFQRGVNRVLLQQPSGMRKFTAKDVAYELADGDSFGLIGDEFQVVLEVEDLPADDNNDDDKHAPIDADELVAHESTATTAAASVAASALVSDVGDLLLAKLLQSEFDEEARVEKATKARAFGNSLLADQILATRVGPVPTLGVGLRRDASGGIRTKKRKYGLQTTDDGTRKSARPHKKVDYAEANFAFIDTDDEAEEQELAAAAAAAAAAGDAVEGGGGLPRELASGDDSSSDAWQPREDTGTDFGTTEAPLVDGKPVCKYGAACFRKNSDHIAEFYHPPRAE
jgi:pSer/pThr/pTyr-binding forkhead associated (FHA) protein